MKPLFSGAASAAPTHPTQTHQRQIHLDFHTSPHIPDVASEFDADEWAQTLKKAHVNSVTVFAKCHHGMCYFPTKTGTQHPALNGRDLLGEQIEALHRVGIRAPIYTTVAWEENVAQHFPQWRMMLIDGTFARCGDASFSGNVRPGGWWFNNWIHPDYQDYIEAHTREIMANYDVDGFFFDIVSFNLDACWSEESRKFRAKHGLMSDDPRTQAQFEARAQEEFSGRFSRLVWGQNPDATLFFNSSHPLYTNSKLGVRGRHDFQSHWELESLPSGFWGYHHFPRLARAFGSWGKPWLAMTGRFSQMWGDFGGLKPQAALEYECFRAQALGGSNSVGDQLPPRGTLDAGAYDLIGAVYSQCERAEPFYQGATPLAQVGIVASGAPEFDNKYDDTTLEGAVMMCDEAHYASTVLDDASDFSGFDLLILPDTVTWSEALEAKLNAHREKGGKLLVSGLSGFDKDGKSWLGLPLERQGETEFYPTYWRTDADFEAQLSRSDRVIYHKGQNVVSNGETQVIIKRVLPYFNRTDLKFCSHFQTPPRAQADEFPAALRGEGFIYFADSIFAEYRKTANTATRDAWLAAMRELTGETPIGAGLPTTITLVPMRRDEDLLLTLLHYVPTRKSLSGDTIEEASSFAGEILRLPQNAETVRDFETDELLERGENGWILPVKKGRLLLEVSGFFR